MLSEPAPRGAIATLAAQWRRTEKQQFICCFSIHSQGSSRGLPRGDIFYFFCEKKVQKAPGTLRERSPDPSALLSHIGAMLRIRRVSAPPTSGGVLSRAIHLPERVSNHWGPRGTCPAGRVSAPPTSGGVLSRAIHLSERVSNHWGPRGACPAGRVSAPPPSGGVPSRAIHLPERVSNHLGPPGLAPRGA